MSVTHLWQIDVVKDVVSSGDATAASNPFGKVSQALEVFIGFALVVQHVPVEVVAGHTKVPAQVCIHAVLGFDHHSICAELVPLHDQKTISDNTVADINSRQLDVRGQLCLQEEIRSNCCVGIIISASCSAKVNTRDSTDQSSSQLASCAIEACC